MKDSSKGFLKIFGIIFVFFIVMFFRTRFCERIIVNGRSMEPTFIDSDVCWSDKLFDDIERYDVVSAYFNNKRVIKRVIGLPGDEILIKEGTVYINGIKINDEYDFTTYPLGATDYVRVDTDDGFYLMRDGEMVSDEVSFTCGDNEYFLLGDNRQNSADCRITGPIDKNCIVGKIVFRFYPFNRIGKV